MWPLEFIGCSLRASRCMSRPDTCVGAGVRMMPRGHTSTSAPARPLDRRICTGVGTMVALPLAPTMAALGTARATSTDSAAAAFTSSRNVDTGIAFNARGSCMRVRTCGGDP